MSGRLSSRRFGSAAALLAAAMLVTSLWSSRAQAAVTVTCTTTAGGIAFGVYNPLNPVGTASTGSLKVVCTGAGSGATNVTVDVSLSTGLSGSYATRTMLSGSNVLNYNIYWSTAYTQIMGNGTGGSYAGSAGPITIIAGGSAQATGTMYGYIPPSQDVAPGGYSDVITVTVTY